MQLLSSPTDFRTIVVKLYLELKPESEDKDKPNKSTKEPQNKSIELQHNIERT